MNWHIQLPLSSLLRFSLASNSEFSIVNLFNLLSLTVNQKRHACFFLFKIGVTWTSCPHWHQSLLITLLMNLVLCTCECYLPSVLLMPTSNPSTSSTTAWSPHIMSNNSTWMRGVHLEHVTWWSVSVSKMYLHFIISFHGKYWTFGAGLSLSLGLVVCCDHCVLLYKEIMSKIKMTIKTWYEFMRNALNNVRT